MFNSKDIKTVTLFVAVAFLLPLLCISVMLNNAVAQNSLLYFILFGVEAASPSIAAFSAILAFNGTKGLKDFFHTSFTPKIKTSAIIAPVLTAFGIMFAAKALSCLIMGTPFQINQLSANKLIIIAWAFFAEELGWRGFLQKKLTGTVPELAVPLILGLIWAAWHYHFFILGTINVPLVLFTAGCIAESYIYLFLLKLSRGNVLTAMLYHLSGNLFTSFLCINPSANGGSAVPYLLSVIITGLLAIGLNAITKKASKADRV